MTQYGGMSGSNGNNNPSTVVGILNEVWDQAGLALRVETINPSVTYDDVFTGTTNANGNYNGTGNPSTIFTVEGGPVLLSIVGFVKTTFVGTSATIEVGNSTSAARYLSQQTATNLIAGDTWDSGGIEGPTTAPNIKPTQIAQQNENIIVTVGTANITAGEILWVAFWTALTPGAYVIAQ